MEYMPNCTIMTAQYEIDNGFLGGPMNASFIYEFNKDKFRVFINEIVFRTIEISCDKKHSYRDFSIIRSRIERLLYIFDGCFIPLTKIEYRMDGMTKEEEDYIDSYAHNEMDNRLRYFTSSRNLNIKAERLVNFDNAISESVMTKWEELLENLGIANQMYLYICSDNGMPIDINCALLIELAESFSEIAIQMNGRKECDASFNPGSTNTTLKKCLDYLIKLYGKEIFEQELLSKSEDFLQCLVNSRVNILHVKLNKKSPSFNGKESLLYYFKLTVLYRVVILNLLGLDGTYNDRLRNRITYLNRWDSILEKFLVKLKDN